MGGVREASEMDGIDFGTRLDFLEQGADAQRRLAEDAFGLAALGARGEVPFPKGPEPQDVFGGEGEGALAVGRPAAWMVRLNEVAGEDGSVAGRWQVWSPVWAAKHTLGETGAYLPEGMSAEAWNDLPEGVAPSDGESLWAALRVGVDCNDYSVMTGGEGATELLALNGADAGALKDTEAVPPQGTGGGTNGVYHVKVKIGEWRDEATAEEKAQGIVRLAFRQRHLGVIVESWAPRRKTQGATLVTGVAKTETNGGTRLIVSRSEFPIPPATRVLEDLGLDLPAGGGLPEGTILYGRTHLEEVRDGGASSGGEVIGYRLTQDKLEWRGGALAETGDSPVEIGVIAVSSGGGGSGACVGPMVIEGDVIRQYYGSVVGGAFVSDGRVAAEIPLYGHAEDHTEGVL